MDLTFIKQYQEQMMRIALISGIGDVIAFLLGMWLLYRVIKAAIRDGINESRLADSWNTTVTRARVDEIKRSLPDMKAER